MRLGYEPGALQGADLVRAEAALADATALALAEVPASTATRWQASGVPPLVRVVVLKAARREWENPQGLRSETADGIGFTVATATGAYLTFSEAAAIRRAAGISASSAWCVRTPSPLSE